MGSLVCSNTFSDGKLTTYQGFSSGERCIGSLESYFYGSIIRPTPESVRHYPRALDNDDTTRHGLGNGQW